MPNARLSTASSTALTGASGVAQGLQRKETLFERRMEWILGGLAVLVFVASWEGVVAFGLIDPLYASSPTRIYSAAKSMLESGTLVNDLLVSGEEFAWGYTLAVAVGVPIGVVTGWYRVPYSLLNPFIAGLYATPRIALMPLVIIWVGIGLGAKVLIIFLGAIFPLIINMQTAMRTIDSDLLKAAQSFGANSGQLFRTIALPYSVPYLVSGLRLAFGHALIGIVVGELYAAEAGIGYRMRVAGSLFRTDEVFVALIILVFAGIVMNSVFIAIDRRYGAWRGNRR